MSIDMGGTQTRNSDDGIVAEREPEHRTELLVRAAEGADRFTNFTHV